MHIGSHCMYFCSFFFFHEGGIACWVIFTWILEIKTAIICYTSLKREPFLHNCVSLTLLAYIEKIGLWECDLFWNVHTMQQLFGFSNTDLHIMLSSRYEIQSLFQVIDNLDYQEYFNINSHMESYMILKNKFLSSNRVQDMQNWPARCSMLTKIWMCMSRKITSTWKFMKVGRVSHWCVHTNTLKIETRGKLNIEWNKRICCLTNMPLISLSIDESNSFPFSPLVGVYSSVGWSLVTIFFEISAPSIRKECMKNY